MYLVLEFFERFQGDESLVVGEIDYSVNGFMFSRKWNRYDTTISFLAMKYEHKFQFEICIVLTRVYKVHIAQSMLSMQVTIMHVS